MEIPRYESHQSPDVEEAELAIRLFHASFMNPEFSIGGVKGLDLAASAVKAMLAHGLPNTDGYMAEFAAKVYEDLQSEGNHEALTVAVKIAYTLGDKDAFIESWYAREEVETGIQSSFDQASEDEKRSVANRYFDKQEFDMALMLARNGYEGANEAVKRTTELRVSTALKCKVGLDGHSSYRNWLQDGLDIDELKAIGSQGDVRFAYNVLRLTAESVATAGADEDLAEYADRIQSMALSSVADLAMGSVAGDTRLLAAELIPQMLASDTNSQHFQKLNKKLLRHFRRAQYTTFEHFRGAYTPQQVREALQNLGELSIHI